MFVFKDMDDYRERGKNVDAEYAKVLADKKTLAKKPVYVAPVVPNPVSKPPVVIPKDIIGRRVKHKTFGIGTINAIEEETIIVKFDSAGVKKMGYEFCMQKKLLVFV